jgi:NDP-sugar pyrophosphorylase family protein
MNKIDTALILAGGLGVRLRPLTISIPKPLLPVGKNSIIEDIICNLKKRKINKIYISINYKGEMIKSLLGNGKKYGVKINYLVEKKKLGTVGSLKLIKKIPKQILVINGDIKTNIDFQDIYKFHKKNNSNLTIVLKKIKFTQDFGVVEIKNKAILDYHEKPISFFHISTGIYIVSKELIRIIPKNKSYGLNEFTINALRKKFTVLAFVFKGKWIDIGNFKTLERIKEVE